jgi:Domain of unknown function (DUF4872)/Butirosin biosynthesis protein H, N-terminal
VPVFRADGMRSVGPTAGGAEEIAMTSNKHLKARIRARMARTGERYTTARRHVAGDAPASRVVRGHALRGGVHPDTAAIAHVVPGVSEAMVLGIGGGLGAGYILWEFEAHDSATLVLGFRREWQYPSRWAMRALERLGVPARLHETGGAGAAAAHLDDALAAGTPALAWVDRQLAGWWHLPARHAGRDGYPVVAYADEGDRVLVDDRTLAPLSMSRDALAAARGRIPSFKHRLIVPEPGGAPGEATLRAAAAAGLREQVEHLSRRSDSFSLPAWRKWARLLTDTRNAKSWPNVFARKPGLVEALLATYEGIEPLGTHGGHLRGLYADFLADAAELLGAPSLRDRAEEWRAIAALWHALADAALPLDVPAFAALREALAGVYEPIVAEGDAGREESARAAEQLWALRARLDDPPLEPAAVDALLADLAGRLGEIFAAETEAVAALRSSYTG